MDYAFPKFPALTSRSYAAIEAETAKVRRILGFSPGFRIPGERLFDSLNNYSVLLGGREYPVSPGVENLEPGVEAKAWFNRSQGCFELTLSAESYDSLEADRLGRPRFTLAHEIGHVVLHPRELFEISSIPPARAALMRGRFKDIPPYKNAEWQANAFAGALLIPATALEERRPAGGYVVGSAARGLATSRVAKDFGVSEDCAAVRLKVFENKRRELLRAA